MSNDFDYKPMIIKWHRKLGNIDIKLIDGTAFNSCKDLAVSGANDCIKTEIWARNVGADYDTFGTGEGQLLWESE